MRHWRLPTLPILSDSVVALAPSSLSPRIYNGRLLRRDHDPDAGSSRSGEGVIHRSRIVSSVCGEPPDRAFNLLEYRDANGRIGHNSIGKRRGDDVAVTINGQMQLAPTAALARGPVLMSLLLPVAEYLQTGRVDDEVEWAFVTLGQVRDLYTTLTS